jgi:hypothetical protein
MTRKCPRWKVDAMAVQRMGGKTLHEVAEMFGYKCDSHVSGILLENGFDLGRRFKRDNVMARFLEKVPERPTDGCWLFTGSDRKNNRHASKYGNFTLVPGERALAASVASYRLFKGDIPKGMYVCHTCDVPRCVNPDHLYVGTPANNTHDCVSRNRFAVGDAHGKSKMTSGKVVEMRKAYAEGATAGDLATKYGISVSNVRTIIRGITWKHVIVDQHFKSGRLPYRRRASAPAP